VSLMSTRSCFTVCSADTSIDKGVSSSHCTYCTGYPHTAPAGDTSNSSPVSWIDDRSSPDREADEQVTYTSYDLSNHLRGSALDRLKDKFAQERDRIGPEEAVSGIALHNPLSNRNRKRSSNTLRKEVALTARLPRIMFRNPSDEQIQLWTKKAKLLYQPSRPLSFLL
jgi:hypothetical protein